MSDELDLRMLVICDSSSLCEGCRNTASVFRDLTSAERALLESWREKARAWRIAQERDTYHTTYFWTECETHARADLAGKGEKE